MRYDAGAETLAEGREASTSSDRVYLRRWFPVRNPAVRTGVKFQSECEVMPKGIARVLGKNSHGLEPPGIVMAKISGGGYLLGR